jgi:hypothetical protein
MSNINGASGQHYISNADFLVWMQEKTDSIYTKMGDAMDVSNNRADAEDALNTIKAKTADVQAGKADANDLYALVDQTIKTYGDEFPGLKDTLDPIAKELNDQGARLPDGSDAGPTGYIPPPPPQSSLTRGGPVANPAYEKWAAEWGVEYAKHPDMVIKDAPAKVSIDADTAKRWEDAIKDRVDNLSKDDQLGLINIQEYNAQLNQAKQTAAALMDAADKSANAIISHIA